MARGSVVGGSPRRHVVVAAAVLLVVCMASVVLAGNSNPPKDPKRPFTPVNLAPARYAAHMIDISLSILFTHSLGLVDSERPIFSPTNTAEVVVQHGKSFPTKLHVKPSEPYYYYSSFSSLFNGNKNGNKNNNKSPQAQNPFLSYESVKHPLLSSEWALPEPVHIHTKYIKGLGTIKGFNITNLYSLPTAHIIGQFAFAGAAAVVPSIVATLMVATLALACVFVAAF